ncbi:DDE-type integrase/transposase/recombinase [Spiroplasma tabanidicola]|uniref:Integrase catalytic domain-containing protein n=1 Tax=Spiroplasma tabanidicola TaxID=324079 RepID=A0A6I6CBJ6_9MOLU|nr:DDE-type integrase/transposase/recombinase [Spiroplasma tabanidicola]QGS52331.1 hypothetical protein STABA_v1c09780 [Spiroplasma tabanidicola]
MLNRNFKSYSLNQKWVTDVTYIKTDSGNAYLSVIKDLYNSEIVDWKLSNSPNGKLCYTNLISAIKKRGAHDIIHSDQVALIPMKHEKVYVTITRLVYLCQEEITLIIMERVNHFLEQ